MASITKKITFDASPTSPGDIYNFGGPHISSLDITNSSGESIAYSTNSGSSYTTLASGGTASLGSGYANVFRFRRVNSGGYPLAIDASVVLSGDSLIGTLDTSGNTINLIGPDGSTLLLPSRLDASIPSPDYHVALRGGQTGYGSFIDQSSNANDATINTALFPPAWTASTALALGVYKSPTTLNGNLYRVTTAGTTGGTQPTWPTTIGGTVVDGTVTWTCEKGPWYINATTGLRHFRSIGSAQLGVTGAFAMPAIDWDMAAGDSLIINIHGAFDFSAADEAAVITNRSGSGNGFSILATGTAATFKDFKIFVKGGSVEIGSGHVASSFSRKPLNGSEHTTTIMIDGKTKIMYCYGDGIAYTQAEMFNGSNICPHNRDLSTITASTLSTEAITIGGVTGAALSYELGMMYFDVLVLKNRSLPADIQGIANWFHQRGLGLIPYGTVQS